MSGTTRPAGRPGADAVEKRADLPYSTIAEAAALAKLGWHVFPIAAKSKRPLVKWVNGTAIKDADFETTFAAHLAEKVQRLAERGIKFRGAKLCDNLDLLRATDDQRTVARWWHRWPQANIGIASEPSGLLILDVDRHDDLDGIATLKELVCRHSSLSLTVMQRTGGGGVHLFFKMPADRPIRNSVGKLGSGFDVRGVGGMVVVAPSVHQAGAQYDWLKDRAPWSCSAADVPGWLIRLIRQSQEPPRSSQMQGLSLPAMSCRTVEETLRELIETVRKAQIGTRNNELNRVSFSLGRLAAAGFLDGPLVLSLLASAALEAGLQEWEIAPTLESGWTKGLAKPWGAL